MARPKIPVFDKNCCLATENIEFSLKKTFMHFVDPILN